MQALDQVQLNEYLFKVLVIGEPNVGKTSLIKRYVNNEFSNKYKYTIGVDFALKSIDWNSNTVVRLQLWDIAGQERFGVMTHVYYKSAVAACIVFDVSNAKTLEAVTKWKDDLDQKVQLPNGDPVPAILLANKIDLPHSLQREEIEAFVKEKQFAGWFEVSAKANLNLDIAMNFLIESVMVAINSGEPPPPKQEPTINLSESKKPEQNSSCCIGGSKAEEKNVVKSVI